MGFGHRIYKKDDPRSNIIKEYSIALSKTKYGRPNIVEVSKNIERRMVEEKKIYPNLDFYSASAYNQCGIHTYLTLNIEISSRLYLLSRGLPAGLLISSNNASPRRSSDLCQTIQVLSLWPSLRSTKDRNYDSNLMPLIHISTNISIWYD